MSVHDQRVGAKGQVNVMLGTMTDQQPADPCTKQLQPAQSGGLDALVRAVSGKKQPPVDSWNPPYCGDIGLEILRDGTWHYQGSVIARPALVALFASVLRKDADGATYLVTPVEKVLVRVADAPFLAVEIHVEDAGHDQVIGLRTNLDDWVTVGSNHPLRFELQPETGGLKPYVRVRGRLEALLTRAIVLDLVTLAEATTPKGEALGVWSGGTRWALEP
jgi:uncharacterized protein